MAASRENVVKIASWFLETSSDSSDDEIICCLKENNERPKIKNYIGDVVHLYSEKEFKRNFRVSHDTCYSVLIPKFENSRHYPGSNHGGISFASAENHILSFLWFAGNKCCIRDVASRFGIGESTFFRQFHRVLEFLLELAPNVIRFPATREEKEVIAHDFRNVAGFPNVLGCIDGSYIPIRTPAHKIKSTYINRHDQTSVTLQGICNAQRKFIDVFTGTPSKIHEARVYQLSFISKELPGICSNEYHIIGDSAYPLREWLLTPYRDYGTLTRQQQKFNYSLSSTRVLIENTFGLLKQRFRQLQRTEFLTVDKITKFIVGCCVMHNLCIDNNDHLDEEVESHEALIADETPIIECNERETLLRRLGEKKRERISVMLN